MGNEQARPGSISGTSPFAKTVCQADMGETMENKMSLDLPEGLQKELFLELVNQQDQGVGVALSRTRVAKRFKVSVTTVIAVERQGLAKQWPPID